MANVVERIDHLLITTEMPHDGFRFFTDVLKLPEAWPMTSYGGYFSSGGIAIGPIKFFKRLGLAPSADGILGIAFEPRNDLNEVIKQLQEEKLKYSRPREFRSKGEHMWTNVSLKGFLPRAWIFFCQYEFDSNQEKEKNNEELYKRKGGALGIKRIEEITIHYKNKKILRNWETLLCNKAEKTESEYRFKLNDGVSINLVHSNKNVITSFTLKVEKLEAIRHFLVNHSIRYKDYGKTISIFPHALTGTKIRFVE
ncbi:hypothetical protein ACE1TH_06175 [Shouchella sp. JSM 1781072]|uniref:hypothetical protein n=1 Tax=Shouchella sp. JSM 1781072 TaxID=3344581 RepID=UPI0035BFDAC6